MYWLDRVSSYQERFIGAYLYFKRVQLDSGDLLYFGSVDGGHIEVVLDDAEEVRIIKVHDAQDTRDRAFVGVAPRHCVEQGVIFMCADVRVGLLDN